MSAGMIDKEAALDVHLEHIVQTMVLLVANLHTNELAPAFEALLERWWAVDKQETLHWIAVLKATALVVDADNTLDALVDELSNTLKTELKGDTTAPLYTYYFEKQPHELRRPTLSSQLETMSKWIDPLSKSPLPSLQALSVKIAAAVKVAKEAEKALDIAKQESRDFRMLGDRPKFVDDHNAARKSADGILSEMPHKRPELGLPRTFARRFFKRVSPPKKVRVVEEPRTAAELALRIAEVTEQLEELKEKHDEALLAEKALADEQAQHQADEEALEAVEGEVTELLAKRAALRAKLGR